MKNEAKNFTMSSDARVQCFVWRLMILNARNYRNLKDDLSFYKKLLDMHVVASLIMDTHAHIHTHIQNDYHLHAMRANKGIFRFTSTP